MCHTVLWSHLWWLPCDICGPPEPPRGSPTSLNDHRDLMQRLYVLYNVFECLGLIMLAHM